MSQQNKSTGKAPAPEREPYTLPPIFWNDADEEPKQATRPIYLVYVSTIDKTGDKIPLDCTTLEGLPEYPHQLAERYGAPLVELIARDQGGVVVARVTHRCRVAQPAAAGAAAPNAGGQPATTSSMSEALALVTSINDRTDKLMGMLIASKDQSNALIVETISKMSGARMIDQQDLLGQLLKSRGGGGGGSAGVEKGELATFMKGIDWAQKMMAAGVEEDDESGIEGLMTTAVKEFMRAKAEGAGAQQPQQPRPRPRAVPDPEGG